MKMENTVIEVKKIDMVQSFTKMEELDTKSPKAVTEWESEERRQRMLRNKWVYCV